MDENLVGYLLNALDADQRRRVEEHLRRHPGARGRLARLRRVLEPLALDAGGPAPPPGLVRRTLGHVAARTALPAAPPPRDRPAGCPRPWIRRIDLAVAAAVLLVLSALVAPWVVAQQRRADVRAGQRDLTLTWTALQARAPDADAFRRVHAGLAPVLLPAAVEPGDASTALPPGEDEQAPLLANQPLGPGGGRNVLFHGGQVRWLPDR
jgi:hypothetical protein